MKREVRLTILGGQDAREAVAKTETDALYYKKDGSHYFLYEENMEGFSTPFKSRIKIKDKSLELYRQGTVNIYMMFEEGKTQMTRYPTPYGELLLKITTASVQVSEKAEGLLAVVEYVMEAKEGVLGEYRLEISAREK